MDLLFLSGLSSAGVLGSRTVVWRGRATALLTSLQGDRVSGVALTSMAMSTFVYGDQTKMKLSVTSRKQVLMTRTRLIC